MRSLRTVFAVAALAAMPVVAANAADMTGAGSTFVYPILSKWSADYNAINGDKVNYQSIGSGGGIAQIKAATVDFGASDMPLKAEELGQLGMGQFPLVDWWRRARGQYRRCQSGRDQVHRALAGRHLPGQGQELE